MPECPKCKTEETLSDKREEIKIAIKRLDSERLQENLNELMNKIQEQDKEFIDRLKREMCSCELCCVDYDDNNCEECEKIDKLTGEDY